MINVFFFSVLIRKFSLSNIHILMQIAAIGKALNDFVSLLILASGRI